MYFATQGHAQWFMLAWGIYKKTRASRFPPSKQVFFGSQLYLFFAHFSVTFLGTFRVSFSAPLPRGAFWLILGPILAAQFWLILGPISSFWSPIWSIWVHFGPHWLILTTRTHIHTNTRTHPHAHTRTHAHPRANTRTRTKHRMLVHRLLHRPSFSVMPVPPSPPARHSLDTRCPRGNA